MKKLTLIATCVLAGLSAWAQGTVNFANFAAGVDAPVTISATGVRVTGPAYASQLFFGPTTAGNNISAYTPVAGTVNFQSGAGAGYFLGGNKVIPGFGTGASVKLIVAAFSTANGADYLSARATGTTGISLPVTVSLGGGVVAPPNMTGLAGFGVAPVPEPSTIALGVLGAAALLLRRRSK